MLDSRNQRSGASLKCDYGTIAYSWYLKEYGQLKLSEYLNMWTVKSLFWGSVNLVRDATCWQCEHEWRQDIAVVTKWLSGMSPQNKQILIDAVVHAVNEDYVEMANDFTRLGFLASGTEMYLQLFQL